MRRLPDHVRWALALMAVIAILCISYVLALLGEPSSAWLWRLGS